MRCDICENQVGDEQKHVCYITKRGQVTLCTSCISKGMRKGSGAIVRKQGVIAKPVLVFVGGDAEARRIAEAEGWVPVTTGTYQYVEDSQTWPMDTHWCMAQNHYWFARDGEFKKNVNWPVYDCFRVSCQNIRDYFGVWLTARGTHGLE